MKDWLKKEEWSLRRFTEDLRKSNPNPPISYHRHFKGLFMADYRMRVKDADSLEFQFGTCPLLAV